MRILLSPAKQMTPDEEGKVLTQVAFPEETKKLVRKISRMTKAEQGKLWGTSDKLTNENRARFREMDIEKNLVPAITSFRGIAYQQMAPEVLSEDALGYLQDHLIILSGLYGVLRPFDGITPYRLEMGAPLKVERHDDLYSFWGKQLYAHARGPEGIWVNLASDEYSAAILPYMTDSDRVIHVNFGDIVDGKVKRRATHAKMARGQMVRFLAERQVTDPEEMKAFTGQGFRYMSEYSTDDHWSFIAEIKA